MDSCHICKRPIDGPHLSDLTTGSHLHPACLAKRLPEEAILALIAVLALVLVPTIVVWAG